MLIQGGDSLLALSCYLRSTFSSWLPEDNLWANSLRDRPTIVRISMPSEHKWSRLNKKLILVMSFLELTVSHCRESKAESAVSDFLWVVCKSKIKIFWELARVIWYFESSKVRVWGGIIINKLRHQSQPRWSPILPWSMYACMNEE